MKTFLFILCAVPIIAGCGAAGPIRAKVAERPKTFCNPVNVDYRFMKIDGGDGIREAADPVVVEFGGRYYLFASKSSGYWYSDDFADWTHVLIDDTVLPIEDYAPGLFVYDGYLYYVGSTHGKGMLYRSPAPDKGEWEPVKEIWSYWDPAFLVEGDKLYLYYGCSPADPIYMRTLDLRTLEETRGETACFNSDKEHHGWERTGEHNELERRPYIEGAWMTAHGGRYYLQYAAPGTEWKSYADGAYVSSSPEGPFEYMENSPVSYKPTGFLGGAGHGCIFTVGDGNYWKAATNSISVRHMFERRVSFYPAGFDGDGYMYTDTYLGDYPTFLPDGRGKRAGEVRPGWMLLSYGKRVTASSALEGYPAGNAVDEDARTAWVAATNGDGEWFEVDLGSSMSVCAIQVNFDEYGAAHKGVVEGLYQSYVIYASADGAEWYAVADRSGKRSDTPHDYIEFEKPFKARYIKLQNAAYTVSQNLSLRDLRIFGLGHGRRPQAVEGLTARRDSGDGCRVRLSWNGADGAQGYIVRYGIAPDKLYNNFQVMGDTSLEIGSLNSGTEYYFTVDAFNESGITRGRGTEACR